MNAYLLSALLVLLGIGLFVSGRRGRAPLPRGRMTYIDAEKLQNTPETLYDPEMGLAGRPDFLMQTRDGTIPVEVKSSMAPPQPHRGHVLQLAAYCRLVESTSGRRPPYGIISYRDHTFRIQNNRTLQRSLRQSMGRIRMLGTSTPQRSHEHAGRCRACGYRATCDQALI